MYSYYDESICTQDSRVRIERYTISPIHKIHHTAPYILFSPFKISPVCKIPRCISLYKVTDDSMPIAAHSHSRLSHVGRIVVYQNQESRSSSNRNKPDMLLSPSSSSSASAWGGGGGLGSFSTSSSSSSSLNRTFCCRRVRVLFIPLLRPVPFPSWRRD